jgi:hypothetical protein
VNVAITCVHLQHPAASILLQLQEETHWSR